MTIIKTNSGKEFDQIDGESILGSAKKAGINFQYSCKTGRCSSCKCKLISGNTQTYSDEIGLTESEVKDGYILSCIRYAEDKPQAKSVWTLGFSSTYTPMYFL